MDGNQSKIKFSSRRIWMFKFKEQEIGVCLNNHGMKKINPGKCMLAICNNE